MTERSPVFVDTSGRRWRRIRRVALVGGVLTTVLGLGVALSLSSQALVPELHPTTLVPRTHAMTRKEERERTTLRRLLDRAIARTGIAPVGRHGLRSPGSPVSNTKPLSQAKPIMAGFYVNWDENSYASLDRNIKHLDWIVGEWAFVDPSGDSLDIRLATPEASRAIVRDTLEPPGHRPQLIIMVSNYDQSSLSFRKGALSKLLSRPAARARAIEQLRSAAV